MREPNYRVWIPKEKLMVDWNCMMQTAFNNINILEEYDRLKEEYENKSPIERGLQKLLSVGKHIRQSFLYIIFSNPDYIKLQYIGINDKNDKDIYDGDIVKYSNCIGSIEWDNENARYIIRWRECEKNQHLGHKTFCSVKYLSDYEVIGNIYENSELLK